MAPNTKEVKVKVATEEELSGVEALELRIDRLNKQRIQLHIDTQTEELNKASSRIEEIKRTIAGLEAVPAHLGIDIDEQEINKLKGELAQLEQQSLDLQLSIETSELKKAEAEIENLDNKEIDLQMSVQNFSQGISQAKQGISELKQSMDEVAQAGMQSEQNKAFLEMNLGADKAKQTYQDISDIVASMPGDDNTMRSVLSTAQALGNNLKPEEMKAATATMADYMSGSATMGKQALESQQDIMKYLLDGNTAELERGSIVSSQVDKLKEATTFQERQAAMQQVLNELGYGGIANQDTMLNKQAEWEGMIYNSQDALSSMWLDAEKGAMDYILQLNESTNGLVGMGIVAGQMAAGPLVDLIGGFAQVATGVQALQGLGVIEWFRNLGIVTKINAAAQWLYNAAMSANPIMLVVLAVIALITVLGYLYFNNEQVRAAIDGLGQSLMMFGQWIYNGAIYWLQQLQTTLMNLWNYIVTLGGLLPSNVQITGNQILDTIIRVLAFIATLPMRISMIFIDIIAKALGFGNNFSQRMLTAAWNAVTNFGNAIAQIPSRLGTELGNALNKVNEWAATLPQKFWDAGVNAVKNFLNALGIHSPGTMQRMLVWEIQEMGKRIPEEAKTLLSNVSRLGSDVIDKFGDPTLGLSYDDTMNSQLEANAITGNQQGITVIFNHYGDIDNEDRQNKVVDAVIRALSFENDTAGRTV